MASESKNLKWWILFTVIIGTFLGRLDSSILNLALPKIIENFGISVSSAGWIATAYIIANAVFVPIWGKLGDTIGRKRVYLWGFGIFIVGSVLCGLAWNLGSMILFRIVQAIASSADYPTAMAIITVTFERGKERAQALGIWSSSFATAVILGPLIGGPLIDSFGWRSVFFVNIPIGLLGVFMAMKFVKESISTRKTNEFDWSGAINLGIILSSLVLVLDQGGSWGWFSTRSLILYFVIVLFSFLFYHFEKNHREPIIDFKFFKNPVFVGTLTNNFIVFMGMMGGVFLIPLFAQTFLGYNATQSGYLFIPMAVFMMLSAQIGGRLVGKVKSNKVIFVSTAIAALGLYLFSLFLDPRSSALDVIIPLSIFAFGMGLGMAQRTSLIANAVPEHEIGVASSILALVRNIAGGFGIAIFATVLENSIKSNVLNLTQSSVLNSTDPSVIQQFMSLIILKAQILGYIGVFKLSALFVLVGAIAILFLKLNKETPNKVKVHVE
ncbi:Putative multidrug resistance protein MdtD [uncultured archaeon]|nr:Putative multidrug resistance protein MdtD [uncultured archaeon]